MHDLQALENELARERSSLTRAILFCAPDVEQRKARIARLEARLTASAQVFSLN